MGKKKGVEDFHKVPTIGERLEVDVDSVAYGGSGVGRVRELVIFIPSAVDGERLEVEISDVRRSFAIGRIIRILKASPFRITPRCGYYGRCGGCQYQHITYAHQLEIKRKQVIEVFERIGRYAAPPVRNVIPSPVSYGYRGKAEIHIQYQSGKAPVIGAKEASDSRIVEVSRCEIVDESINRSLAELREKVITASGKRRQAKREERVILWSGEEEAKAVRAGALPKRKGQVIRTVKGFELKAPAQGFFQVNTTLLDTMIDSVIQACALSGQETVLDAYCGSGLFSLFLAPYARKLFGVDLDEEAIFCARENLLQQGIENAEFFSGDMAGILKKILPEKKQTIHVVILDPPRIGCGREVLDRLLRLNPERIVYISCNPATQARDMLRLLDGGYLLKELQPLDMFPQTKHIEVIGLLEREEGS